MGLKLRLDMPEQAMDVTTVFFRSSTPANEAHHTVATISDSKAKNMKVIQERMKLNEKEAKRFNPVDAFPGDIVIFTRVLNLLRGLSTTMKVHIVYLDIMKPFAEYVLQGNISEGPISHQWIHDTPVHSDVEAKLRQLLVDLGNKNKILGVQVCAYKDGKVIIDTAAGVLGRYDARPVQPDSLFPVFSASKGITAGMIHWLVDNGKLNFEEFITKIWPGFGSNKKDLIKVHHVLNHTSGLHNAFDIGAVNPLVMCDWDECLNLIAKSAPESGPGQEQLYHYLTFGWLCGGIIEHASRKKFQEILEEVIVRPLKIDGELYIGIPPGVEPRLATLTLDTDDLSKLSEMENRADLPSSFQPENISQQATALPALFNMLNIRRAIIPAVNAHCSARALARYYAALADSGSIPPPHSALSKPPLGSHPHVPEFCSTKKQKKSKDVKKNKNKHKDKRPKSIDTNDDGHSKEPNTDSLYRSANDGTRSAGCTKNARFSQENVTKIFKNSRIHDAFMGVGEYGNYVVPNGKFGLGFRRIISEDKSLIGFGHSGMGGSTGFCDIKNRFAIAVTLNKMSFGAVTANIIQFICSELNIPVPEDYSRLAAKGPGLEFEKPVIN